MQFELCPIRQASLWIQQAVLLDAQELAAEVAHALAHLILLVGISAGTKNAGREFELVCRLGYKIINPAVKGNHDARSGIFRGQQYDACIAIIIFVPATNQVGHLETVHAWHPEISQHHVGTPLVQ